MSALDTQVGGGHYKDLGMQPVEFWHANLLGASEGSVIKYVTRWRAKKGLQDLQKAEHFLQLILEDQDYLTLFARQREAFPFYSGRGMEVDVYIRANNLENPEAGVIRHVYWWHVSGMRSDLNGAVKWMDELLEKARGEGYI